MEESNTVRNNNQVVNQFQKQNKHEDIHDGKYSKHLKRLLGSVSKDYAFIFLVITYFVPVIEPICLDLSISCLRHGTQPNVGTKITGQNKVTYSLLPE